MQNTHLRTYVKKHPDNKMAWYLLGKEYVREGQEGKANYCFQQAGEVYEAFERSKAPADIWVDYQNKLVEMGEQKEKKQRIRKMWLTLLMLLVLALVPPADAPGFNRDAAEALASALETGDDDWADGPISDDREAASAPTTNSNVLLLRDSEGTIREKLRSLLHGRVRDPGWRLRLFWACRLLTNGRYGNGTCR